MEINKITHDPQIIAALENKGITSLEQIALSSPNLLGLSESKAKRIIFAARNELIIENIESMEIDNIKLKIILKNINKAIYDSICSCFDLQENNNCMIRKEKNSIEVFVKGSKKQSFKNIIKKAKEFNDFISLSKIQRMKDEGITLPTEEIRKFAREKKFEGFHNEFFKDIMGNELMKKAMTISLFSTFDEPVHSLILGDPGSAKTLARDILIQNLSGINSIGANATKAGLVCNLSNGELGALAVSDKKVVLIDEFDKLNKNDLEFCYELLSNGKCSVHSARVHRDIISKFILLAFGNPKSNVFSDFMPIEDIGMEKTLLSRFAFIIRTDKLKDEEKRKLFEGMIHGDKNLSKDISLFDQWVKLARTFNPKMEISKEKEDKLIGELIKIVNAHSSTNIRRDIRMGLYFGRIAKALARIEFKNVDDKILQNAFDIIKESVDLWNFKEGNLDFF